MSDSKEFVFEISDSFSPETIPMARLTEYMEKLVHLFGFEERVHFGRLQTGSVDIVVRVELPTVPKVEQRLRDVDAPDAPTEVTESIAALNNLLRADNARGFLRPFASNAANYVAAPILTFPGKDLPIPTKVGPVAQFTMIDGKLNSVGGVQPTAHIIDAEGRRWIGDLTVQMAKDIGRHLYEWMRFSGDAKWERTERGSWDLKSFKVRAFDPLPRKQLKDAVEQLRRIEGNEWREIPDPIAFIKDHRSDDNEIH